MLAHYFENYSGDEDQLEVYARLLNRKNSMDFDCFKRRLWDIIGGRQNLCPLQVWTQIRSFIKGSYEAAQKKRPLTMEEYLNISPRRCRLGKELRRNAYNIFERYQAHMKKEGWWDDMDRIMELICTIRCGEEKGLETRYDKIYIDEVQDMTQAEIGFFILLAGGRTGAIFLAGDTAQAVTHGVDFRFEEIRSLIYEISEGKQVVAKPTKLHRNFRSHEGVLCVARLVLDQLHAVFPFAAAKMPPETGLMSGPKPLLAHAKLEVVKTMLRSNPKLKVLVRDERRHELLNLLASKGVAKGTVFGIREAKGLEFGDVLILNFFGASQWQREWKELLGVAIAEAEGGKDGGAREGTNLVMPGEMELELKLLYTGITRSCHRLLFIETEEVQSSKAWFRCLRSRGCGSEACETTLLKSVGKGVMTEREWLAEGVDLATVAEDRIGDEAVSLWEKAVENFRKCGVMGKPYLQRAQAGFLVSKMKNVQGVVSESQACAAAKACFAAGLIQEAAVICERQNDPIVFS